jgi:hypothetical protein
VPGLDARDLLADEAFSHFDDNITDGAVAHPFDHAAGHLFDDVLAQRLLVHGCGRRDLAQFRGQQGGEGVR